MSEADTFKDKGNKAFAAKDYDTANEWFSKAIEADPSNHVLFSNRSACYAAKKNWGVALEDAKNQDANPDTGNLGMGKFFSDPALMSKLSANPKTAKHLADPSFMQKLQMLQQNPRMADRYDYFPSPPP
ncbi:hypothetical protein BDV98DRAFT_107946 [Pterulicium gracile]|uniref:STI1 domain-containing protein n=1 Tax=Pterulicium gracile TaxID=1884261 RepID=A0A5C3QEY7_9AGAR|nr:hypothetical protein BDV98DRAFT_107946 [Pterula gracilis]